MLRWQTVIVFLPRANRFKFDAHEETLLKLLHRWRREAGQATVPTIVVVSACYSGSFATGKMAKPNRIVLTAARNDRPSFGCQVRRVYNFFDECLLGALPKSATWRAVANGSRECVRRMERALGERPSEPQAYFGAVVANLDVGF